MDEKELARLKDKIRENLRPLTEDDEEMIKEKVKKILGERKIKSIKKFWNPVFKLHGIIMLEDSSEIFFIDHIASDYFVYESLEDYCKSLTPKDLYTLHNYNNIVLRKTKEDVELERINSSDLDISYDDCTVAVAK